MHAADLRATLGNESLQKEADGRVHAQGFFDDGLKVWEILGFGEGDRVGQFALGVGSVDFSKKFVVCGSVAADIVEDCTKRCGRRV